MSRKQFLKQSLDNKSILITGGTGFFGKSILNYLRINKIEPSKVTILTRNAKRFSLAYPDLAVSSYIEYLEQDILNLNYISGQFDYIIHAATSVLDNVSPIQLSNEIIRGTQNVLNFSLGCGAKAIINISSGAVYGNIADTIPVTEDKQSLPVIDSHQSSYGLAKLMAEHYAYLYSTSTLKVTTLRCFCFGGVYLDDEHYVLGYLIKQAITDNQILVKSGRGTYRSYLSTDDLVEAMLYLLVMSEERESNYEVYNLGSDEAITIPDLAYRVREVLKSNSLIYCPNIDNSNISYYIPDVSKIRTTGLLVKSNLEEIILTVAKYYASQY